MTDGPFVVGETIVDMQPVDPSTDATSDEKNRPETDAANDWGDGQETDVGGDGDEHTPETDALGRRERPETYERRLGGAPANVAVGLARLGRPPALWTRVGEDALGWFLTDRLRRESVASTHVVRDPDAPTGLSVVSRDSDGDRSFALYLDGAASTRLDPARVERGPAGEAVAAADWCHVGGVDLAHEPARSAVFAVTERAGDAVVSFDPNYRASLWDRFDYADTVRRLLGTVDVVVASAADLTPAGYDGDPESVARSVAADGPHTVFVTRGADGAVAHATENAPWGPADAAHDGFDPASVGRPADSLDWTDASDGAGTTGTTDATETTDAGSTTSAGSTISAGSTTSAGDATSAVDTTGAGDAFTAGVIRVLRDGHGDDTGDANGADDRRDASDTGGVDDPTNGEGRLATAVRVGNAAGVYAVTARGATTGLPTWETVRGFLARHDGAVD